MSYLLWNSYNKWLSYDLSVYFVFCMQEGTSSSTAAKMNSLFSRLSHRKDMEELRKEQWRQQEDHLRDLHDQLEDKHHHELQQLHRQEKLDLQDKHRQARQDLIDMYKTELQRQDAEIQRLTCKRQLLHQQQTPSQQLTRQQDESKDLQDQVCVTVAMYY